MPGKKDLNCTHAFLIVLHRKPTLSKSSVVKKPFFFLVTVQMPQVRSYADAVVEVSTIIDRTRDISVNFKFVERMASFLN
jgi:hypothetical protein